MQISLWVMQCLPIFVPHEKMYDMPSKTTNAMPLFWTLLEFLKDVFFLIQIYSRPFKCNYIHSFLIDSYERKIITWMFDVLVSLYEGT